MKKPLAAIIIAFAWLLIVTILLCTPGSKLPKIDWQDKVWLNKWVHVFLFLIMVLLWCRVYRAKATKINMKNIFISITIASLVYGILMEIVQSKYIPFRSFEYGDILADAIGAAAGYFISIRRYIKK